MNRDKLIICDEEEDYCYRMDSYLRENLKISFTILDYTAPESLLEFPDKQETVLLIIAGNAYKKVGNAGFDRILILDGESKDYEPDSQMDSAVEIYHISKYSTTDKIVDRIMEICISFSDDIETGLRIAESSMKVTGFYSPITRCLQTTAAITMGQLSAQNDKTLYLNFEAYGEYMFNVTEGNNSLSDLLYYNECSNSSMKLMLEKSKICTGGLDMICPVSSPNELRSVTPLQWIKLFTSIAKVSDYHSMILDLSDCMTGAFDILRYCDNVYTITRDDRVSSLRQQQYEKILHKQGYEDIMAKTVKIRFPLFKRLPGQMNDYKESAVADYMRKYTSNW